MKVEKEIRSIIKEQLKRVANEGTSYDDRISNIEDLAIQMKDANRNGNEKEFTKLMGILTPQLAGVGFDKRNLAKLQSQLKNATTNKELYTTLSSYRLIGEADEELPKDKKYDYKVIVSIPFSTSKNKDEKIKKLKYHLVTNGIKILGIKELPVSKIATAGDEDIIQLEVLLMVRTIQKRTEFENVLQPDYKLVKIKDVTKYGSESEANK